MYKIIRSYQDPNVPNRTIKTKLTLEEAQKHCQDPETSYKTCLKSQNKKRTKSFGPWFDGYVET